MKHVILGAGPAGIIAAETIRKHDADDEIIVIGAEAEAPYSRMAIPYMLIGNVGEAGTHLRHGADHFSKLNVQLKKGVKATRVDIDKRAVSLSDGSSVQYERLLIATGSKPAAPPIPGIDLPGIHPCWTLDDARAIMTLAKPGSRVLQMGAGFIGCIIMEALAARGVKLTVVEMGDRMVPRMMGPAAGTMIKDWVQGKGVTVHTGAKVEAIEAGASGSVPLRAKLSSGQTIDCDLIISATGVKPDIAFLKDSGIRCATGIVTDTTMQCNVPGVYAAGDCAEAYDKVTGTTVVSAIQPNASEQARVAALNMVGQVTSLRTVTQINVLDTLGLISSSFGAWHGVPGGTSVEVNDAKASRHLSLQFAHNRLVGCNSVGWTDHVGAMRGLVEGQVALGEWEAKLKHDPTQLMAAYLACAQGQSAKALVKA
jgi:NAD(P)H-nitrite reductase large subunit